MAVVPCTSTPIVLGIVTFDPAAFVVLYPEFTGLTNGQMNQAFALAQVVLNNTCCSRVRDANTRDTLLQMLTAHICFLLYGTNDGAGNVTPAPGIIGHIDTATEGSVSVGASFGGDGGPTQDWYTSSKYGAMYWVMTSQYRTALYLPAAGSYPPNFPSGYPGLPFGGGCGC
jgi:hypothetical protein